MKGPALGIIVTIIAVGGMASDLSRKSHDPRQTARAFQWVAPVPAGQELWIRNTSGRIEVRPGTGDQLEVIGERSWRRSDPESLRFIALPHEGGVTICAVWGEGDSQCGPRGEYHLRQGRGSDLAANFTVYLPRGVRLDASTTDGPIEIAGATAPIKAKTVSGNIEAHTAVGPVVAYTTNGSLRVTVDSLAGTDAVELETVNGSIVAQLPAWLDANLEARTVNGRIESDYEMTLTGRLNPRNVSAQIGKGGRLLRLATVNGSIRLERAGEHVVHMEHVAPEPPQPPRAAPHPRVRVEVKQH